MLQAEISIKQTVSLSEVPCKKYGVFHEEYSSEREQFLYPEVVLYINTLSEYFQNFELKGSPHSLSLYLSFELKGFEDGVNHFKIRFSDHLCDNYPQGLTHSVIIKTCETCDKTHYNTPGEVDIEPVIERAIEIVQEEIAYKNGFELDQLFHFPSESNWESAKEYIEGRRPELNRIIQRLERILSDVNYKMKIDSFK